MYRQKIGISLANKHDMSSSELLPLLKQIGFDAVSPTWEGREELIEITRVAGEIGLEVQSLHAPIDGAAEMWREGESETPSFLLELYESIDACAECSIPVLVVHAWIGFGYTFDKDRLYFGNLDRLVDHARKKGVKLAFENTEGLEYLDALMKHFEGDSIVGYCWDSGHEMCYNYSEDLLARWGDRLYMMHLNDNLGIKSYEGEIIWKDDLHLLPYDGIADWDYNMERLSGARDIGILNLELKIAPRSPRHESDAYAKMTVAEYYTEAYKRATKIAYRYLKYKK